MDSRHVAQRRLHSGVVCGHRPIDWNDTVGTASTIKRVEPPPTHTDQISSEEKVGMKKENPLRSVHCLL